ncbi:MAG: NADH:ubiquinone reductase (Na(+)-transporting) subunit A, partial [Bacteroidales bacterium]|nr:NADH:ubiquinone reductase (Na(+)-transporting) subunit A [Bacteroidales bacterium]
MDFVIRKGLDLKIAGEATDKMFSNILSDTIYVSPGDFRWLQPKLLVNAGDIVQVGTPLFCDKQDERIVVVSPVAGIVKEIVRGEKRVVQYVAISRDAEAPTHLQVQFDEPSDGRAIRALLLQYGLWPSLRQR